MKKHIIFIVGLLTLGATQVYSMEQQPLTKEQQKEFRAILAGYRQGYLFQQVHTAIGESENKAEARLRKNHEELLNDYKRLHGNDPFVTDHFKKLEKFKSRDVANIVKLIKEVKTEQV